MSQALLAGRQGESGVRDREGEAGMRGCSRGSRRFIYAGRMEGGSRGEEVRPLGDYRVRRKGGVC